MRIVLFILTLVVSGAAMSEVLEGEFHIHRIPPAQEKVDNELRGINFIVKGPGAEEIYTSIEDAAYFDECDGVTKKRLGNFICQIDESSNHSCYFSLNIKTQALNQLEC